MLEKLEAIEHKFKEIETLLSSPDVIADMKRFTALNRSYKEMQEVVDAAKEYRKVVANYDQAKTLLDTEKDADVREMAKMEVDELAGKKEKLEEHIRMLLVPSDPEDERHAIVEIRAGTGGDEASL